MAVDPQDSDWINLGVALAVGFLIGIERERSKGTGPGRAVAGLRTFTLISLAGALGLWIGGVPVFIATGAIIGAAHRGRLPAHSRYRSRTHHRDRDGRSPSCSAAWPYSEPRLAAAVCAVIVAILLAFRNYAHNWVKNVLTDEEVRDGLLLAAAALVILPLDAD